MQYKVKLNDERIIGPLSEVELKDLLDKKEINKNTLICEFPIGDWVQLSTILKMINKSAQEKEDTFIKNLKKLQNSNIEGSEKQNELDLDQEKSVAMETKKEGKEKVKEFIFEKVDPLEDFNSELDEKAIEEEKKKAKVEENTEFRKDEQKTLIRKIKKKPEEVDEPTKINMEYQKYLLNLANEKKEELKQEKEEAKKAAEELKKNIEVDYENESTQILNLNDENEQVEDIILVEKELADELIEKKREKEKIEKQKEKRLSEEEFEDEFDDDEQESLKKKSKFVTIIAVLIILFLVLDDDEKVEKKQLKEIVIINPKIKFPQVYDIPDKEKSLESFQLGLVEESKETYISLMRANAHYRDALENDWTNLKAAARLIMTSSKLLKNSNDYFYHGNLVFKLVQNFKDKVVSDVNIATAVSYFYYVTKKPKAALKIFDVYMTLNKKKVSVELFVVRLKSLLEVGDILNAKKIATKLESIKNKKPFLIETLIDYYRIQSFNDKLLNLLEESLVKYPNNIMLNIERANLFLENLNLDEVKKLVVKLNSLNVEGSVFYYSKYLILKGMYLALNDNLNEAIKDLKKSLSIYESPALLQKLSQLEQSENNEVNSVILLGKSKIAISNAKEKLKSDELEEALKIIIDARVTDPESIELKLFLADLQMKRGYIQDAINQLEAIYKENASSPKVLFSLINAYIEAHKYRKALELLSIAQNLNGVKKDQFYGAKAKLSIFKKDFNTASGWLQRAINSNPMNDFYRFELAKLYINYHRYNKGKAILKQAMDLDPSNLEYNLYFAEILYEVESSSAAIGYLYDILKDYPDNPKILSKIGIYFYRSGQIKKYKAVKKELLALPKKTKSLFEFLVESARLDDEMDKVIKYSEDLIEIDPGDLAVRMDLARNYITIQEYKKAKKHLDNISERLDTYPMLQYLFARLYYYVDEIDKAKELILKEIRTNPNVVEGYILYADILIKEKKFNEAKKQYLKAVRVDSKNIDAILGIAFIAFQNDQYDMALDQYQKALEVDPNKPEVYKLLGDAYRKLGQSQFAVKNYKHYLELSPNTKYKNTIETYIRTMQ